MFTHYFIIVHRNSEIQFSKSIYHSSTFIIPILIVYLNLNILYEFNNKNALTEKILIIALFILEFQMLAIQLLVRRALSLCSKRIKKQ